MLDIAALTGVFTGLNYARNLLQGLLKAKVALETHEQIDEALEKLGQAQATMFEMRDELFQLQQANEDLRRQLKARDDWNAEFAEYRRATAPGGASVFEYTGTPPHYACPVCINERKIQPLQDCRSGGLYACPSCKATYPVKVVNYGAPSGPISSSFWRIGQ
jgi:hypothetical protein